MTGRLPTALFGCGRVGAGYADDPVMVRHYPYASHTQVLADHPAFEWVAAVDTDATAAAAVAHRHGLAAHGHDTSFAGAKRIAVAILAVPPGERQAIVNTLPTLRAVIVEKPLGATVAEAASFLDACRSRDITVQVNLPRRADADHRALADGGLAAAIGQPQGAFLLYGNGLANNATHMIDLVRMLLGEVAAVQVPAGCRPYREGPINDDVNVPFTLRIGNGTAVMAQPLAFDHYRENAIDVWGDTGRLSILQEGLRIARYPRVANRAMSDTQEIASDAPTFETTTIGTAFRAVYDDLAAALTEHRAPVSTGASALVTARIVAAVRRSAQCGAVCTP